MSNLDDYINARVKEKIESLLAGTTNVSGNLNGNEMLNFLLTDKAYVTPNLTIRKIEEREKLVDMTILRNGRKW